MYSGQCSSVASHLMLLPWSPPGKLFGEWLPLEAVGPDQLYKLQLLKVCALITECWHAVLSRRCSLVPCNYTDQIDHVGSQLFSLELTLLKDESKSNKTGRPELVGTARHKDSLFCAVNAMATIRKHMHIHVHKCMQPPGSSVVVNVRRRRRRRHKGGSSSGHPWGGRWWRVEGGWCVSRIRDGAGGGGCGGG